RQEQGLYKNTTVVRGPIFEKYPLGGLLGGQKTRFLTKNGGGTKRSNFDPFFWTPKNVIFSTFFDFFGFFTKKEIARLMPHSTRTVQKKGSIKKGKKTQKNQTTQKKAPQKKKKSKK